MAKTLVTHINPHLDDIAAIWLCKKFHPGFGEAEVEFISASKSSQMSGDDENTIYLGVGRGKFDEHKGDLEDCATSLVWKYLKENNFVPQDEFKMAALEELVEWVRLDDLGRLTSLSFGEFSVASLIRVYGSEKGFHSKDSLRLGLEILERILRVLVNKHRALKDWQKRVEFKTKWGKGVGVVSEYVNRSFCDSKEGDIFLMVDPKFKSVQFYTPKEAIDLEPIYQEVKKLDPQADWFLHQSHKMVICGSGSAPSGVPTSLDFDNLIEVAKRL